MRPAGSVPFDPGFVPRCDHAVRLGSLRAVLDRSPDPLRALLDAAREGDERAVTALIEATSPAVSGICRMLGSPSEIDDLVQETYIRALVSLDRYSGAGSVIGWFLAIARNTCADHVRRRQRQARLADRLRRHHQEAELQLADWHVVTDAVSILDSEQRDAFLLTQMLGFTYQEAAALLGCPVGTVRSRVARGRARLLEYHESEAAG
jgi:RNA polymerase sigma-70 factor (ECF subfamily)